MTPLPFWLMMASRASAVFPVCRSPMTSSRWPRPMLTIESTALMPVSSGSRTGWRAMTPGAILSMAPNSLVAIGPLPSMGCPRALITRPTMSSPTGTDMMRRVRLTSSPSLIFAKSPMSTAPTESSSRLRAMPITPWGRSSSSPAMQRSRPWMRAMPSPRDRMVPTSETSTPALKPPSCSRMILVISSARMSIQSPKLCPPAVHAARAAASARCRRRRGLPCGGAGPP